MRISSVRVTKNFCDVSDCLQFNHFSNRVSETRIDEKTAKGYRQHCCSHTGGLLDKTERGTNARLTL